MTGNEIIVVLSENPTPVYNRMWEAMRNFVAVSARGGRQRRILSVKPEDVEITPILDYLHVSYLPSICGTSPMVEVRFNPDYDYKRAMKDLRAIFDPKV